MGNYLDEVQLGTGRTVVDVNTKGDFHSVSILHILLISLDFYSNSVLSWITLG